jgi:hypothetical protein
MTADMILGTLVAVVAAGGGGYLGGLGRSRIHARARVDDGYRPTGRGPTAG